MSLSCLRQQLQRFPSTMNTFNGFSDLQLPNVFSCRLEGESEDTLEAQAVVVKCSSDQVYCCLAEESPKVQGRLVQPQVNGVNGKGEQHVIKKIDKILDEKWDPASVPMYMVHEKQKARLALSQVLETALENALGELGLEFGKNATVDLEEPILLPLWRDALGFCVGDSLRFVRFRFSPVKLLPHLSSPDNSVVIQKQRDADSVINYDSKVCRFPRQEFLRLMSQMDGVQSFAASDEAGKVTGVALTSSDAVRFLYADSEAVARSLLRAILEELVEKSDVKMTVVEESWLERLISQESLFTEKTLLRRLHTTLPPSGISWPKVYAVNTGLHIV